MSLSPLKRLYLLFRRVEGPDLDSLASSPCLSVMTLVRRTPFGAVRRASQRSSSPWFWGRSGEVLGEEVGAAPSDAARTACEVVDVAVGGSESGRRGEWRWRELGHRREHPTSLSRRWSCSSIISRRLEFFFVPSPTVSGSVSPSPVAPNLKYLKPRQLLRAQLLVSLKLHLSSCLSQAQERKCVRKLQRCGYHFQALQIIRSNPSNASTVCKETACGAGKTQSSRQLSVRVLVGT